MYWLMIRLPQSLCQQEKPVVLTTRYEKRM
jgi:hypothetical protein